MEMVVLLDDAGAEIGTRAKAVVHTTDTPLHLAFSSYIVDNEGSVLLTQRATDKLTWPGVWTNSCCGHPAPGESLEDAVLRRVGQELGIVASQADLILPSFRYRAVMDNGIVENEMCPVFRIRIEDGAAVRPDPREVADIRWVSWIPFASDVLDGRHDVSPWCAEQIVELAGVGGDPLTWPVAATAQLPPAARL